MDVSRLHAGEWLALLAGIALLALMFIAWYGADVGGGALGESLLEAARRAGIDTSENAWEAFSVLDVLLAVTAAGGIAIGLVAATRPAPAPLVAAAVITTALGLITTLLLISRIVNQPGDNAEVTVEIGAWLGLLACAGVVAGAIRTIRDEGTTFPESRAQTDALMAAMELRPAPPAAGS